MIDRLDHFYPQETANNDIEKKKCTKGKKNKRLSQDSNLRANFAVHDKKCISSAPPYM